MGPYFRLRTQGRPVGRCSPLFTLPWRGIVTLTQQNETPTSGLAPDDLGAGAPEVTSKMIQAGVDAYR